MSDSTFWHIRPASGRQLLLFPFLGGFGASFNRLVGELDPDFDVWAVNPPGHGGSSQPPYEDLAGLIDFYVARLETVLRPDAVFFGHSMGGIVAQQLAIALRDLPQFRDRNPTDLVLSASASPRLMDVSGFGRLSKRDLIRHLLKFGAIPSELADDRGLIDLLLPSFRADYLVLEDVQQKPIIQLDLQPRLILGSEDPHTPPGTVQEWQRHFTRHLETRVIKGAGHMFVHDHPVELGRLIGECVDGTMVGGNSRW